MRILFDSKKTLHKDPFGTLTPEKPCRLHIHIPCSVGTTAAECVLCHEDGQEFSAVPLTFERSADLYDIWAGDISFCLPGLYFYYFRITGNTGTFRLFKYGDDTNMEAGDLWQVSCVPEDFTTPQWAKGAVIYQVFPDRFYKSGQCDLTGKLPPYTLHESWDEEVYWQAEPDGTVRNNDFFGGNFAGIIEKMPYMASLGVGILYLNPICKSFSNHRYDTADYKTPDPMLGTCEDFRRLCDAAHALGIRVVLDGVFSHTGADSIYFDKYGHFGANGAYHNQNSPYSSWYTFYHHPDSYNSWWGFDTLPTVNKLDPKFIDYIITDENSVVAHWLGLGADGFRLDVADELPDAFILLLKQRLRQLKPDALLMGEVWEDASNKISYGVRRRYFTDGALDSIMNYPFRTAILDFVRGNDDGQRLRQCVMTIAENYPQQVLLCNMNLLGTHDTSRILTALVDDFDGSREALAARRLSDEQLTLAIDRLFLATFLQYTLPGAPSIYYGDEAGMQGYKDPFNRRPFVWGKENADLTAHYRQLGALRNDTQALKLGDIRFFSSQGGKLSFCRTYGGKEVRIYVNLSDAAWDIAGGKPLMQKGLCGQTLAPMGYCILED